MAHTKSQGKTNQKSNRPGQRRGVKKFGGQKPKSDKLLSAKLDLVFAPVKAPNWARLHIYAIRPV